MADSSFEHADEARAALRAIASDPAYGAQALSSAAIMSNLLRDFLPDAPRESGLLTAAAERPIVRPVIRRVVDIAVSSLALALSSPVLVLVALAIRIESRGPVLYRQRRVGLNGRPFDVIKLRTMVD